MQHRRTTDVATANGTTTIEREDGKRADPEETPIKEVRASDIEPYTGLRYLSKLFKFMAIIVILLIIAEVVTGLSVQGASAIPTLLGEISRLIVLAGVLWGTGDLALLLIDVGHDVRASRILLARQTYHATKDRPHAERNTASGIVVERTLRADSPPTEPHEPPPIP